MMTAKKSPLVGSIRHHQHCQRQRQCQHLLCHWPSISSIPPMPHQDQKVTRMTTGKIAHAPSLSFCSTKYQHHHQHFHQSRIYFGASLPRVCNLQGWSVGVDCWIRGMCAEFLTYWSSPQDKHFNFSSILQASSSNEHHQPTSIIKQRVSSSIICKGVLFHPYPTRVVPIYSPDSPC